MVKLAVLLDPLRILYSLAPLVLVAILVPSGGLEDVEVLEQSLKSFEILVPHQEPPLAPSCPRRPERSRAHHSYDDPSGCLRTIFPRAALALQRDHRGETVDARGFGERSKT